MNIAAAVSVSGAMVGLYVLFFQRAFISVGRFRGQRWVGLVALTGSLFVASDVLRTLEVADWLLLAAARFRIGCGAVAVIAWLRYSDIELGVPRSKAMRALVWALAGLAVVGQVPGLVHRSQIFLHAVPLVNAVYRDARPTGPGAVLQLILLCGMVVVPVRFLAAARRRVPGALAYGLGTSLLCAAAVNDALVAAGVVQLPYLLDVGQICQMAALGFVSSRRWAEDVHALDRLSGRLGEQVKVQAADLQETQKALARSERLAAVGRLASGVAHEINNPAAAAIANLSYLIEHEGPLPEDTQEVLRESHESLQRIARIVRQLSSAGRESAPLQPAATFDVADAVRRGVVGARAVVGDSAPIRVRLPECLWARGRCDQLEEALAHLIINGVQALATGGPLAHVEVSAREDDDLVYVSVRDTGSGMTDEVRAHLFEPFFTTRPFGEGSGLGLAVSRGLLRGMAADLAIETAPGQGTTVTVTLLRAEPECGLLKAG